MEEESKNELSAFLVSTTFSVSWSCRDSETSRFESVDAVSEQSLGIRRFDRLGRFFGLSVALATAETPAIFRGLVGIFLPDGIRKIQCSKPNIWLLLHVFFRLIVCFLLSNFTWAAHFRR